MPRIKLINNGSQSPLPSLPSPKLDRESRPSVRLPGLQEGISALGSANHGGPLMPMELANLQAKAGTEIGAAFAQTGDMLFAMGEKAAQAKNESDIADGMMALKKAAAQFEVDKDPTNPSGWAEQWAEVESSTLESVLSQESLSPAARRALTNNAKHWSGNQAISVQTKAAKAEFARAKSNHLALFEEAVMNGDQAQAEVILAKGAKDGHFWDHEVVGMRKGMIKSFEADERKAKGDQLERNNNYLATLLDGDPDKAKFELDDPEMFFPGADAVWLRRARAQVERESEIEKAEHAHDRTNDALLGKLDEGLIDMMVKHNEIEPVEGDRLKRIRRSAVATEKFDGPFSETELRRITERINKYADEERADDHGFVIYSEILQDLHTMKLGGGATGEAQHGALRSRLSSLAPARRKERFKVPTQNRKAQFNTLWGIALDSGSIPGYNVDDDVMSPDVENIRAMLERRFEQALQDTPELFMGENEHNGLSNWLNTQLRPYRVASKSNPKAPKKNKAGKDAKTIQEETDRIISGQ